MGVPHLRRHLEPYAQRNVIKDRQLVVDGPAFAYHILFLCMRGTRDSPFDYPSYGDLGTTAIRWLDRLCAGGNTISAVYFDGFLPDSKKEERMRRTVQVSRQLLDFYGTHSSGVPAGRPEKRDALGAPLFPTTLAVNSPRKLPLPAFAVPAVLEALRQSKSYAPLTKIMPGEADVFCAKHAALHGATILTSDSDLLVHMIGKDSSVVFIQDLEASEGKEPSTFRAAEFKIFDICQRLALDPNEGLAALAFELTMDHYQSFDKMLKRLKQKTTITAHPEEYTEFLRPYQLSGVSLDAEDGGLFDPRISEIALGWSDPTLDDRLMAYRSPGEGITMYLPFILDCPSRSSAWEPSKSIRVLAYSLVQLTASRPVPSAVEFRRIQSASRGTRVDIYRDSADIKTQGVNLGGLLASSVERVMSFKKPGAILGIVLSIYLDIAMSESQGKSRPLSIELLQQDAMGLLNECHWEFVHLVAQIQGTLYSLRMLQQLVRHTSQTLGSAAPSFLLDLQSNLSTLPSLSRFPSLGDLGHQLREVRETGGWGFMTTIFDFSKEMICQIEQIGEPEEAPRKKRKRKKSAKEHAPMRRPSSNPFNILGVE